MKNQQIFMLSEEGIKVLAEQITENIKKAMNPSNSSTEDVFMNIDETAKLINLAKPSVYGLVHQNRIPYHKKGNVAKSIAGDLMSPRLPIIEKYKLA